MVHSAIRPAICWPWRQPVPLRDIKARAEYHRSSDKCHLVGNFSQEPERQQSRPDQLQEIEGHDGGWLGFLQGLAQADLGDRSGKTDEQQPAPSPKGWVLPDPKGRADRKHRQENPHPGDDGDAALRARQGLNDDQSKRPQQRRGDDQQGTGLHDGQARPQDDQHADEAEADRCPSSQPDLLLEDQDAQDRGKDRGRETKRGDLCERRYGQCREEQEHRRYVHDPAQRMKAEPACPHLHKTWPDQQGHKKGEAEQVAKEGDLKGVELAGRDPDRKVHDRKGDGRGTHHHHTPNDRRLALPGGTEPRKASRSEGFHR